MLVATLESLTFALRFALRPISTTVFILLLM
ncbi:hypothetical protein VPHK137_0062 [Vibrio phage K137]